MLIKERMTVHPLTMGPTASITEAHRYMKENNIRHLPIVRKDGKLAFNPSGQTEIHPGDILVTVGISEQFEQMRALL